MGKCWDTKQVNDFIEVLSMLPITIWKAWAIYI